MEQLLSLQIEQFDLLIENFNGRIIEKTGNVDWLPRFNTVELCSLELRE